ncbi:hypothetical protein [Thiocapsa rosea]|uniref:hypothetical protein n=1 Tax=Thiocapsa rosea TaxID=69360 RepID=UPI0011C3FF5C|nr:hypothetical protein [Thiocapsa rosea]
MKSRSLTFGDVNTANEILYLTEVTDPRTGSIVPLGCSLNGTAHRPPERGDLLVNLADRENPEWRAGHVAAVGSRTGLGRAGRGGLIQPAMGKSAGFRAAHPALRDQRPLHAVGC